MKPKPREVRAVVPESARQRSTSVALVIFCPLLFLYLGSFAGLLTFTSLWSRLSCAAAEGLAITLLFGVGHDACHNSFARQTWINKMIGRIAFLPSFYPYTSWELGHNRLHHCWTNLKGRDYVWAPLALEEYQRLSFSVRLFERVCRHPFGFGLYALVGIWWRHMMWPKKEQREKMPWLPCLMDRLLVSSWLVGQTWLLVAFRGQQSVASALLIGLLIPQCAWLWVFGTLIFLHHTHPKTRWFDSLEEWSFFGGQVENTVHVTLPDWCRVLLMNIMEHTAHHIDPAVPLYRLHEGQVAVTDAYNASVIVVRFSFFELWRIARVCQLYDYRNHRWLSFSGVPTT